MSRPSISVRIAFTTDPLDPSPAWTDVSAYVRGETAITIRRGRQYELNRIEAGTARVALDNRDRRFDPTNTSSPYYPNVVPMRKISIQATYSAVTYDLYTGYIENWPPDWPAGYDSTVTISCVDGYAYFANALLTLTVPSTTSGWQIKSRVVDLGFDGILVSLAWANGDQSVNAGDSTLQGWTITNGNVLQQLQLIADSENGYLMMTKDGKIFFRERHFRLTNHDSITSTGTFGDGGGSELPYTELLPSFDNTQIYNDIHVTRLGGAEQVAQDATSQLRYFKRSMTKSGLLITTDNEANDAAYWLLGQYKDPALRFRRMTIAGPMNDSLWAQVLGRDINHRITVTKRPPGSGTITQDCFIEGIEHTISRDDWLTSFDLSPASSQAYWVMEDVILGILDSTTRLIY
jgi:hypothetical protein